MGVWSIINRFACACASIAVLAGCVRQSGGAAANAPARAGNTAALTAAPPTAAAPQSDANAAANAANATVDDETQARTNLMLAQQNADCVDQLIKAQPFGETRSQIIDNVTRGCLPIVKLEAQSSPSPATGIEAAERKFVTGQAHELIDEASSKPDSTNEAKPASGPS